MVGKFYKRILGSLLCVFVASVIALAPFTPTFEYQKAEAITVFDATNLVENAATAISTAATAASTAASAGFNAITSWATGSLVTKEFTLDGIAWLLINSFLESMLESVIDWVNNGFEGSPSFVQDLRGFLVNVADGVAGEFILGTPLSFMCSPFQLDIRYALSDEYLFGRDIETNDYTPQCYISEVLQNIQNFTVDVNGNIDIGAAYNSNSFATGGWAWWLGVTQSQGNTVFGAYSEAQAALNIALRNAKGEEVELLNWGRGFLSFKKCDDTGACSIVTPGAAIQTTLENALNIPSNRLTIADEINELIAAVLNQLVQQVLGDNGLFGVSSSDYAGSGSSYWDYFADDANGDTIGLNADTPSQGESNSYSTYLNGVISDTQYAIDAYNRVSTQYPDLTFPAVPQEIIDANTDAKQKLTTLQSIIDNIDDLYEQLSNTTDQAEAEALMDAIETLQDALPSASEVAEMQREYNATVGIIVDQYIASLNVTLSDAGQDTIDTAPPTNTGTSGDPVSGSGNYPDSVDPTTGTPDLDFGNGVPDGSVTTLKAVVTESRDCSPDERLTGAYVDGVMYCLYESGVTTNDASNCARATLTSTTDTAGNYQCL